MENLDLTQGLCGWNAAENNDQDVPKISNETELRNMFHEMKIINPPKKPYPKNHAERPKSSSLINIKRRYQPQNTAKTARTLSKRTNNTSKIRQRAQSSQSNYAKSSKAALFKAYLPSSNRKKLQRSCSNLYIREPTKSRKNNENTNVTKDHKARELNIELNLNSLHPETDNINADSECITFSEALYRSKYPVTVQHNNVPKSQLKSKKHKKSKTMKSSHPNKFEQVLMTVDDFCKQHHIKHTARLTPSTSMKTIITKKTLNNNNNTTKPTTAPHKRPKTYRKSRNVENKTTAIPIKCFNSTMLITHRPNTVRESHLAQKYKHYTRSKSVDIKDNELKDNGFSVDIEKYHEDMIRNKENVKAAVHSKGDANDGMNIPLELKLKTIISRWKSQEKLKSRKSQRLQRIRPFK